MHHAKCPHVRSLTAHKVTEDTREVVILCLLSCNVTGGSSNLCCLKIDKPALRKSDHEADAVIYERCLTGAIVLLECLIAHVQHSLYGAGTPC